MLTVSCIGTLLVTQAYSPCSYRIKVYCALPVVSRSCIDIAVRRFGAPLVIPVPMLDEFGLSAKTWLHLAVEVCAGSHLRQEMPCSKASCIAEAGEAARIACQDLQQVEQDKLPP